MIDRPTGGERAVLVHVHFPDGRMQEDVQELKELALSAGATISGIVTGARQAPDPKYFVGTGKAQEIQEIAQTVKAELIIFNHALSPAQERNLERLLQCRVVDRTGLILDIFAQRARTFEGKLQVELALLKHLATRLVRGWTHLERQRGGIGLRGPGETQLEVDRRLIRNRIKVINARLAKVRNQRQESRKARRRAELPTVVLVGYTNAGKSTLFNRLSGADVYVANRLFATLDPTLRRIEIPDLGPIILADTVGFIRHLPHDLVEAFHATLEEVAEADLLLHVVDAHDEQRKANITQVNTVLQMLKAGEVPQVLVYNKIDLCDEREVRIDRNADAVGQRVWVSAITGAGIEELHQVITEHLGHARVQCSLTLTHSEAKLRAQLYAMGAVVSEEVVDDTHYALKLNILPSTLASIRKDR